MTTAHDIKTAADLLAASERPLTDEEFRELAKPEDPSTEDLSDGYDSFLTLASQMSESFSGREDAETEWRVGVGIIAPGSGCDPGWYSVLHEYRDWDDVVDWRGPYQTEEKAEVVARAWARRLPNLPES